MARKLARPQRQDTALGFLAMTAGATDALSFLGLGGVFSSVMTANVVLLGLSAGQRDGALALRAAVALAGYVLGALAASALTRPGAAARPAPARLTAALAAEGIVLAAVTVGWELTGGASAGAAQVALLAGAAAAMGVQGAAVRALGVPDISTTYMTGMLTGILADLATGTRAGLGRRLGLLGMLVLGALASGITFAQAPRLTPLIPLAALSGAIALTLRR
jgi:uncharacterized membrane protein YoaK (UPF0700 family)